MADNDTARGSIGQQTYERVQQLISEGSNRTTAFQTVAAETGRSPGTVATAFYRVARRQPDGGGVKARPRKAGKAPRARRAQTGASADRIIADLHRAVDELGSYVKALEGEVIDLRGQAQRYDEARRLFSR